jgi:hypothetical protein
MGVSWLDVQLGVRMLIRYKGITLAGGLALAIAIGLGAGWYDVMRDQLHPTLPLPDGDRLVEVEVRNAASSAGELRVPRLSTGAQTSAQSRIKAHYARAQSDSGDARPQPVHVANTASAFRLTRAATVWPPVARCRRAARSAPGRRPRLSSGKAVWRTPHATGGCCNLTAQLIVVGVMPEGFAFPENHKF